MSGRKMDSKIFAPAMFLPFFGVSDWRADDSRATIPQSDSRTIRMTVLIMKHTTPNQTAKRMPVERPAPGLMPHARHRLP